ncbi:MAG: hypothetical protein ABW080_17050 [Candidatus Thiodiazotropha sp.]
MSVYFKSAAIVFGCGLIGTANADSILTFEKSGPGGVTETRTVSITGRWLRIDSSAEGGPDYTLMDTGRMLMFEVDDKNRRFRQSHMGKYYWPKDVMAKLKPMREKAAVSGVRCRKVDEIEKGKSVANHCMVAGIDIGLNERKTKSLSRLFLVSRRMKLDWVAATTPDERQVSISSHNSATGEGLKFISAVHKPIPDNRIKIPDEYKPMVLKQEKHKHAK